MPDDEIPLELADVLPHLSERGRLEWELAVQRATNTKLIGRIGELTSAASTPMEQT